MKKNRHQGRDKRDGGKRDPKGRGSKPQKHHKSKPQKQCDLFGIHAVTEAVLNPKRHIHDIIVTQQGWKILEPAVQRAVKDGLKRPEPRMVEKHVLEDMLPDYAVHQGMGICAQNLHATSLEKFCESLEKNGDIRDNILVMLDQVTDPHNVGAILRSASVFGAKAMIVQERHAPDITGTLAKVACGAVEHIPVIREVNLSRSLELLKQHDILCVGLDERGQMTLADVTADQNLSSYSGIALVMGAEGDGLRRLTAENCDILARLPATGPIKSLNVSNAAAVSLYEMVR